MPTVSEPIWPERDQRIKQCVTDFVGAKPREVDDSEDVLTARLFGLGLRGQDLQLEVHHACLTKFERQKCPKTGYVCRAIKFRGSCVCPWGNAI